MPVHAEYGADGEIYSNGLSYDDCARMQTNQHKQSSERQLPTPDWAVNDNQLRQVLTVYLEHRAYGAGANKFRTGTGYERLRAAEDYIMRTHVPTLEATLRRLVADFMRLKVRTDLTPD